MLLKEIRIACHVVQAFVILCIISPQFAQKNLVPCKEGEMTSIEGECWSYMECLNGESIKQLCPSQSYFDSDYEVCVVDASGTCSSPLVPCLDDEIRPLAENACGYRQCVNGTFTEAKCADGSYFNATLIDCIDDENGICSKSCSEGELTLDQSNPCGYLKCINEQFFKENCTSGKYFNTELQQCAIDESGICATSNDVQCLEGELSQDPTDCAGYLQCVGGALIKGLCSYGSYFHQTLKRCVVDLAGSCMPISEACQEGDREEDPKDCTSYSECIDGDLMAQTCDIGNYFDISIKQCIIDVNNTCIPVKN